MSVEEILSRVFKTTSHWKAILLLDEADVFVEQRTTENTPRNALVSVFLRQLEYHDGIVFLTTNRVKTFDEAMASRVHLAMRYDSLKENARKEIWQRFLARAKTTKREASCKPKELERLTMKSLNGREVSISMSDTVRR